MRAFSRCGLFALLGLAMAACSSPSSGGATPAMSSNSSASAPAAGGHLVFRKLPISPNAGSRSILLNFVANGPAQGGVPCIGCVNGATSNDNIGMTGPSSYVFSGATWQYALSYTDISYVGKCKLDWKITAGKKTIDSFSAVIKLTSKGGFVLYALDRPRPSYSGSATLTGTVTCGTDTQSTQAPLEFQ